MTQSGISFARVPVSSVATSPSVCRIVGPSSLVHVAAGTSSIQLQVLAKPLHPLLINNEILNSKTFTYIIFHFLIFIFYFSLEYKLSSSVFLSYVFELSSPVICVLDFSITMSSNLTRP
jgi:hypothetical protein